MKNRASCKTPRQQKIDDFGACFEKRLRLFDPRFWWPAQEGRRGGGDEAGHKRAILCAEECCNWLNRTFLSTITALSLIGALQAQNQETSKRYCPPDDRLSNCLNPSYNRSARIAVDGSADFFGDVSFIYWNVGQSYLDIGRTASLGMVGVGSDPAPLASVPTQPFEYTPGFKVGLGFGTVFDNWQLNAEYTYLHHSNSFSTGTSANLLVAGEPIIVPNEWFVGMLDGGAQAQAARMASTWTMNLDLFDLFLSRPFYQGQRLNIAPYVGLRGLWIRQRFDIDANIVNASSGNPDVIIDPARSLNRSKGWGIGPHIGSDFNWILGRGFRAECDAGFSLLYMRYTTQKHKETFPSAMGAPTPVNGYAASRAYLRPVNQLGLGFGWGSYFRDNGYHIDFSARYDFSIFWSQNVMRETIGYLADDLVGYSNPIGNLNLHGLTLTTRFDF